jgi:hypothetical protein
VHAERIAGEENAGLAVQGEHCVRPMQIRSHHKLQDMAVSKVQSIAALHPTSEETIA